LHLLKSVKDKVVYGVHDTDLDGVSCRLLTEYFIKPLCKKYIPLNTVERTMVDFNWDTAQKSDIIIFTDIAPSDMIMYQKLIDMNKEVWIFDHHVTSRELLGELPNYIYSTEKCGTKILYDYITEGKRKHKIINDYVNLVNIYDMWKESDPLRPHAESLHNVLMGTIAWFSNQTETSKRENFINKQLNKFKNRLDGNFYFDMYEQTIIVKAKQKIENNYKTAKKNLKKRVDNEGNKYLFTECVSKVSFVASRLLKEYKDYDYIAIRATFSKDGYKFSLRSANGFQVEAIAKIYGGGGHSASSGLELTEEQYFAFKEGKMHLL
jgi:oligoribonuclease NrnB/cAMP/cGMP phosphodiesterase (DHH superfamily)